MTNEELAELERLLAKATPGEWIAQGWGDGSTPDGVTNIFNHDAEVLLMECLPVDDAALIVALRNAAPSLIATAHEVEGLRAENARLRETVDAVWKEATTMRNASKLVGPYPTEPSKHRVWVRSMYHAGKKLHELMKPIRALKDNPNAG